MNPHPLVVASRPRWATSTASAKVVSIRWLERVFNHELSDLPAHVHASVERIPEMDSAPNANIALLFCQLPNAGKLTFLLRVHQVCRGHWQALRRPNNQFEH